MSSLDATTMNILGTLYFIMFLIGFIKLLRNWEGFGGRAWPMLFVSIFIPVGFLWPLLSTPDRPY
jgi:hypothetical protein